MVCVNTPEDDLDVDERTTLRFLRGCPSNEADVRAMGRKFLKRIAIARMKKAS